MTNTSSPIWAKLYDNSSTIILNIKNYPRPPTVEYGSSSGVKIPIDFILFFFDKF